MAYLRDWLYMPSTNKIEDVMEAKALQGDVEAAKALAMLRIVYTTDRIAQELCSLGTAGASTEQGAIELLAQSVGGVGDALGGIESAIRKATRAKALSDLAATDGEII